jgi:MFS family permease
MNLKNQKRANLAVMGWTIVGIGALFYCYEYLLRITPSVMMVPLMQYFNLSAKQLGFLISLYYVAYTPAQVFVGLAHDFFGPRRVFIFAVLLCVGGSFLFSTHSLLLVGIGRFLVGLGSAFAFVGVLKLAAVWLPLNRFAMVVGLTTMLGMLMGVIGNVTIMKLFHAVGWQNTLMFISGIGVGLVFLIGFFIKDNKDVEEQKLKNSLRLKLLFCDLLNLVKNKQVWLCGLIGSALYLSLSLFAELWGNEYISRVFHLSLMQASYINSMVFLGWLIGSPVMGALADFTGKHKVFLILGCFTGAFVSMVITFVHTDVFLLLCVIFFIFGLFCSTENICFAVGRANAPHSLAASSVALVNMLVMLGGMIFQPLYGHLLDLQWTGVINHGIREYSPESFRAAFAMVPVVLLIAGFAGLALRDRIPNREAGK